MSVIQSTWIHAFTDGSAENGFMPSQMVQQRMDSCLHRWFSREWIHAFTDGSVENGFMPSQMIQQRMDSCLHRWFSREWIHTFTDVQQRMDSCLHRCSAENGFMPSQMFSREWIHAFTDGSAENGFMPSQMFSREWIHAFTDVQQRMDSCLHRCSAENAILTGGSGAYIRYPDGSSVSLYIPVGELSSKYRTDVQPNI